ncbi:MAG TPA: hypothetical protein DD412_07660, partial [Holosporales bacterium]|nr:hypothetical protein [Holosporales bacterium]
MNFIQKISTLKLSASFAIIMAAATPNAMASISEEVLPMDRGGASSSNSSQKEPVLSVETYSELEKAFPRHFRGISKMDQEDVMRNRNLHDLKTLMGYNPAIAEKLAILGEALTKTSNPVFEKLLVDIEKAFDDREQQTVFHYVFFLGRSALLASNKTEEERQFFNIAGFSNPYKLIELVDPTSSFWTTLQHLGDHEDSRGDFSYSIHRSFFDPTDQIEKLLNKSSLTSRPFLMLITEPKGDIFGFFALALTYYKGQHPVPVTLSSDEGELHGIPMSPWGKFCHDLAHSEADPADYSVEQFASYILNLYTAKLRESFKGLTKEERAQFSVKSMIPVVTEFALEIHAAYRQSLIGILEGSLQHFDVNSRSKKLPPAFEAFSA